MQMSCVNFAGQSSTEGVRLDRDESSFTSLHAFAVNVLDVVYATVGSLAAACAILGCRLREL